jgi:hypothetical protein
VHACVVWVVVAACGDGRLQGDGMVGSAQCHCSHFGE